MQLFRFFGPITVAGRQLQFTWPGLLVLLVCLPILLRLGFWQLDRAEFKTGLLAGLEAAESLPAMEVDDLAQLASLPSSTRVVLRGEFLPGRSTLLDNRYYRSRVGFNVVSLFQLAGSGQIMLVNRGWVALGKFRYPLPEISTPAGKVTVEGQVRAIPTDTIVLKKDHFDKWPELMQNVDLTELQRLGGVVLPPVWVLASADVNADLKQEWPVTIVGPQRHYGYAVQWFGLAIALIGVVVMGSMTKTGESSGE